MLTRPDRAATGARFRAALLALAAPAAPGGAR